MAATNIRSDLLPQVYKLTDTDTFIVNASGETSIISYANIKGNMNGWNSIANKPFDTYDDSYFQVVSDSDKIALSLSQSVIDDIGLSHKHDNTTTLDAFNVNADGKLTWNDIVVGSDYELPIATTDILGGVKPDGVTITIDENGVISGANSYTLPTATTSVLGGVKPDGTSITVDADGTIHSSAAYELPVATNTNLGGVKPDGTTITVNAEGVIACINEGSVIATWATNVKYPLDCVIIYETTMYKCLEEHTSSETFDSTKWKALTGEKGDAGVSPTAKTEQTNTGATISITDVNGTTTSVLTNGADGVTPHIDETTKHWFVGETDTNIVAEGKDGVSPTATVNQTDIGTTITIVTNEQTTVAELKHGITPIIDNNTKHWIVDGEDSGVIAEGVVEINADCAVLYATFTTDSWTDTTPYTQTVTVNSITADNVPIVDIFYSEDTSLWSDEKKAYSCVTKIETIDGGIVAYCLDSKPESDFTVKLRIAGDVTGLTFVTQDEFDTLYEMINSVNTSLETTLNGGETNG